MRDPEGASPALIYIGSYGEVLFLQSLLESSGISAMMGTERFTGSLDGGDGYALFVARADVEVATPLIEDFRRQRRSER